MKSFMIWKKINKKNWRLFYENYEQIDLIEKNELKQCMIGGITF